MRRRRGLFRRPSIRKRIAARTSWKRFVRQNLGLKAPRGWGWVTNPRKALYNRVYYRTSIGCVVMPMIFLLLVAVALFFETRGGATPRITGTIASTSRAKPSSIAHP